MKRAIWDQKEKEDYPANQVLQALKDLRDKRVLRDHEAKLAL